jgi:hypothetical protein
VAHPDWFAQGTPLPDVYARSSDAAFILDSDFEEDYSCDVSSLIWKECVVPASAFALAYTTLAEHLGCLHGAEPGYERERLLNIRTWIASRHNMLEALTQSPLLVFLKDGRLELADGWHRLGIAVFEHRLPEVIALCADLGSRKSAVP